MARKILVADDERGLRIPLCDYLNDLGYETEEAETGDETVAAMTSRESQPDLVLLDIKMPGMDGFQVIKAIKAKHPGPLPIIVMTAFGSASVAIQAIQEGVYDYITKPFDLDEVAITIERYFQMKELTDQLVDLSHRLQDLEQGQTLVGESAAMQELYKTIGRIARTAATVLITGETGTGKELAAAIIHQHSQFRGGPMVKVNCAALPETLLESELFGHEKGAFTGAANQHKGRFELAHKGTIFLDEIGECSLSTQKKLLRVLQEREFERVGGTTPIKVDTRVIAATNLSLESEIEAGRFRSDLYYRLNVIALHIPPLRERKEDILPLVEYFLEKLQRKSGRPRVSLTKSAFEKLYNYSWPGNVRQLENVIERAILLCRGGVITEDDIDISDERTSPLFDLRSQFESGSDLTDILANVKRRAVEEALRMHDGNLERAAETLGLDDAATAELVGELNLSS